jgi:hypothetical protein
MMRIRLTRSGTVVALLTAGIAALAGSARADIGELKVYTPLIETGVLEFEYRGARTFDSDPAKNDAEAQKLSIGYGLTSWWFVEVYGAWARDPGGSTHFDGTEWESVFQLTEPGEYWANFGLLAEYERVANRKSDSDEIVIGPLIERDFGPVTADLNLMFTRQIGPNITERGIGFGYRLQTRWRLLPQFQPGIEAYGDLGPIGAVNPLREQQHLIGPAIQGRFTLGSIPGNLQYNAGYLFGLTRGSPGGAVKLVLEYELPL